MEAPMDRRDFVVHLAQGSALAGILGAEAAAALPQPR
jgi:hypothetical protein